MKTQFVGRLPLSLALLMSIFTLHTQAQDLFGLVFDGQSYYLGSANSGSANVTVGAVAPAVLSPQTVQGNMDCEKGTYVVQAGNQLISYEMYSGIEVYNITPNISLHNLVMNQNDHYLYGLAMINGQLHLGRVSPGYSIVELIGSINGINSFDNIKGNISYADNCYIFQSGQRLISVDLSTAAVMQDITLSHTLLQLTLNDYNNQLYGLIWDGPMLYLVFLSNSDPTLHIIGQVNGNYNPNIGRGNIHYASNSLMFRSGNELVSLELSTGNIVSSLSLSMDLENMVIDDCNNAPLPIEVLDFQANQTEEFVEIQGFVETDGPIELILEKSRDGKAFEEINQQVRTASSWGEFSYRDLDIQPGYQYYRLKFIDLNGAEQFQYSRILSVKIESSLDEVQVYPTQVEKRLFIHHPKAKWPLQYRIMDLQGGILMQKSVSKDEGEQGIDLSGLGNGAFLFQIESGEKLNSFRIFK